MRQLILKDFAIQKRTAYMYLIMGLLFFFFMTALDQHNMMSVMMPVFIIVYSFINRSLQEDERNHATRLLLCLPVPRAVLVKAKYASVLLAALASFAVLSLVGLLGGALSFDTPDDRILNLLIIAIITFFCTLLVSILIPMVYKIGIVRAQNINRFVLAGLGLLGGSSGALIRAVRSRLDLSSGPPAWLDRIDQALSRTSPYMWVVLLLALAVLMFLVSMQVSIRYFDKREDL